MVSVTLSWGHVKTAKARRINSYGPRDASASVKVRSGGKAPNPRAKAQRDGNRRKVQKSVPVQHHDQAQAFVSRCESLHGSGPARVILFALSCAGFVARRPRNYDKIKAEARSGAEKIIIERKKHQ